MEEAKMDNEDWKKKWIMKILKFHMYEREND